MEGSGGALSCQSQTKLLVLPFSDDSDFGGSDSGSLASKDSEHLLRSEDSEHTEIGRLLQSLDLEHGKRSTVCKPK